jgi:Pentapeptide repeats (8 copies)
LTNADLRWAELIGANLNGARLIAAKLNNADLRGAQLNGALLGPNLPNEAGDVTERGSGAKLKGANLASAKLRGADLRAADLEEAVLFRADLSRADLFFANLDNADLSGARLERANLTEATVAGALLGHADLTGAIYAPVSLQPSSYLAGIRGLETVSFPPGMETGLVQLRELVQKAGLLDLDRQAVYAIESNKTWNAFIASGDFGSALRWLAFDFTTRYGLYPARALKIIVVLWLLFAVAYFCAIRFPAKGKTGGGIYQIWPSERIETDGVNASLSQSSSVTRLQREPLAALGYAAYFSLLSAFHIGWRDLNVGAWIARIQPREYALRATGWVRTVSGVQSLMSLYLLALWALTSFSRLLHWPG